MNINILKQSQPDHLSNKQAELKGNNAESPHKQELQSAKQVTEAMVLQQLVNIDMTSIPKSQELLFRRVVEKLDRILEAKQGEGATQKALDAGFDFSPKAVAQSISAHASNIISKYQAEHQLDKGDAKLQSFVDLIQQAITTGFEEAKGILSDFEVFKDNVENTFDATLTEVQKNISNIRDELGLEPKTQIDSPEQAGVVQNQTTTNNPTSSNDKQPA